MGSGRNEKGYKFDLSLKLGITLQQRVKGSKATKDIFTRLSPIHTDYGLLPVKMTQFLLILL
ncbi:unnamed protein product [marine sediment metagenome]|uniref:Uncharacterized protein n=1 Tax=marine sediment metagenome TaxID=412755 RepID=X1NE50_9ZZZZ